MVFPLPYASSFSSAPLTLGHRTSACALLSGPQPSDVTTPGATVVGAAALADRDGLTGDRICGLARKQGVHPIAVLHAPVYGALMWYGVAGPWCRALARTVSVALLLLSASLDWAWPVPGSHCERHDSASSRLSTHPHPGAEGPATPSWAPDSDHDCSHCPPSECSRAAPCAAAGSIAVTEVGSLIAELAPHRVRHSAYVQLHHHTGVQPPTPPPQLIA